MGEAGGRPVLEGVQGVPDRPRLPAKLAAQLPAPAQPLDEFVADLAHGIPGVAVAIVDRSDHGARSSGVLPGASDAVGSRQRRSQASRPSVPKPSHPRDRPMNEAYLRPGSILGSFSRLYPDAWKQVDDFRANRKGLGGWPDWCFLPLAGAYAIVSKGTTLRSIDQARHVGILGALAAWRVTQGIYRFDPTVLRRPLGDARHGRHPHRGPLPPARVVRLRPDPRTDLARGRPPRLLRPPRTRRQRQADGVAVRPRRHRAGRRRPGRPADPPGPGRRRRGVAAMLRESARYTPVS